MITYNVPKNTAAFDDSSFSFSISSLLFVVIWGNGRVLSSPGFHFLPHFKHVDFHLTTTNKSSQ